MPAFTRPADEGVQSFSRLSGSQLLPGESGFLAPVACEIVPQAWRQRRGVRTTRLRRMQTAFRPARDALDAVCIHRIPRPAFRGRPRTVPLLKGRETGGISNAVSSKPRSEIFFAEGVDTGRKSPGVLPSLRGAKRRPLFARCASFAGWQSAEAPLREGGSNPEP
jgi:hypothetical protein